MNRNRWIAAAIAMVVVVGVIVGIAMAADDDHGPMAGRAGHDMGRMMGTGDVMWSGPMMQMGDMPGMSMRSSGAMSMSDQAFVTMMIPHHRMAVDMARIELRRGSDAQTKALARRVVADQEREIAEMRSWYRDRFGADVPSMPMSGAMGMMGMSMDMDELNTTDEPDRVFLRMMQPHHAGALLMADMVLTGSPDEPIRALARRIVAAQSTEIGAMQEMRERIAPPLG